MIDNPIKHNQRSADNKTQIRLAETTRKDKI